MTFRHCFCLPGAGIGRFLRLTVSNIRLRIAYEDFPSTQRLVAMVQVGVAVWVTLRLAQQAMPAALPKRCPAAPPPPPRQLMLHRTST